MAAGKGGARKGAGKGARKSAGGGRKGAGGRKSTGRVADRPAGSPARANPPFEGTGAAQPANPATPGAEPGTDPAATAAVGRAPEA